MNDDASTTPHHRPRTRRTARTSRLLAGGAAALLASGLLAYGNPFAANATASQAPANRPPACETPPETPPKTPPETPPELKPTTMTTIGQAYYCILDNYYSGSVLDDRSLLVPAFAALTQELQRRGLDQSGATMPALTGKKDDDWAAFSRVYEQITAKLPEDTAVRQPVAEATMKAMLDSLNDNHVQWQRGFQFNMTGIQLSAVNGPGHVDPVATEPLFVTKVSPRSPAERAGVKPGDEIVAVNDVAPYVNGVLAEGVLKWIFSSPEGTPVKLTVHRPATDATFTITVTAAAGSEPPPPPEVKSKLVASDIAYVTMPAFAPGFADKVLAAIAELRKNTELRGVILDLRGNGGGLPEEVSRLLGALAHDKVTSYWCDVKDHCTANRTDDSVELLNLPLVALTDRSCASACDSFTSAVKDLDLGTLVGTRTAGAVSGPGLLYLLNDGSAIILPKYHEIAANKEVVNTIGVAPDHYAPLTAADLSAGRDPGVDKALELLKN